MDTHEFAKAVINDDKVIDVFVNLYCRWQDECMYEDIEEYGRFICKQINKIGKADFVDATQQPFGVKVKHGKDVIHFFAKVNGEYLSVCAKG
jgi:hypothetical protein